MLFLKEILLHWTELGYFLFFNCEVRIYFHMPNYTPFLLLFLIYVIAGCATDTKWICICKEVKHEHSGQGVLLMLKCHPLTFLLGKVQNNCSNQNDLFGRYFSERTTYNNWYIIFHSKHNWKWNLSRLLPQSHF